MSNESVGREQKSAKDAMLVGWNNASDELRLVRNINATPGASEYGIVTRVAGSVTMADAPGQSALSRVSSAAYEASHVVKAAPGTLFFLFGHSSKAGAQWIQVHNATSLPANTAVPIYSFQVNATASNGNFSLDLTKFGDIFSTGIVVCNSTTGPTLTNGSADTWFTALYL